MMEKRGIVRPGDTPEVDEQASTSASVVDLARHPKTRLSEKVEQSLLEQARSGGEGVGSSGP